MTSGRPGLQAASICDIFICNFRISAKIEIAIGIVIGFGNVMPTTISIAISIPIPRIERNFHKTPKLSSQFQQEMLQETKGMRTHFFLSLVFTLLFSALPAAAELRQWTDENGVKHFSNRKNLPEGVSVERSIEEKESHPGEQHPYRKTLPATRPRSKPSQTDQPRMNPQKAAILKEIRTREAKLSEIFDRIYTKRRYVKRHGKQDIDRIRRLDREIGALEKNGADPARLKQLKAERAAAKRRLFNVNLRTRKGVGEDIQEYKQVEEEIAELKKSL